MAMHESLQKRCFGFLHLRPGKRDTNHSMFAGPQSRIQIHSTHFSHSSRGKNNADVGSTEAWPDLTVNLTGRDVAACYVTTPHSGIFSPTALTLPAQGSPERTLEI